jgi:STE24 endopeptidase
VTPTLFSTVFLAALFLSTGLRLWLGSRHMRHIIAHRPAVPDDFAGSIALADHQKAADYTVARVRAGLLALLIDALLLLVLTLGGGIDAINSGLHQHIDNSYLQGIALFACVGIIGFLVELPISLFRTFRIEAKFGFNKMTGALWLADLAKQTALTALIGAPLLFVALWVMSAMGKYWWLYSWGLWLGFNLLVLLLYPTFIAPLFNKFSPLEDNALKARIEALLQRCGFSVSGLFVMDGSKRSGHGNAYFTGFGRAKRIVFFDTLLAKLSPLEVESVLAHELGHFHHRHVLKRIVLMGLMSLGFLWGLGQLIDQPWFYAGLGITKVDAGTTALGLLLFSQVLPVFMFPLTPLSAWLSRKNEYEADAYAAKQTAASDLISALVKLYRDNAATLTPDPLHSLFYDSHPPARLRIANLRTL